MAFNPDYLGGGFSATFVDLTVTGDFTFGDASTDVMTINGQLHLGDDVVQTFGNTAAAPNWKLNFETADANANALLLTGPEGGATDVPVFILADASAYNVDLTFFNGVTDPTFAVLSDDKTKYVRLSHNGTNANIATGGEALALGAQTSDHTVNSNGDLICLELEANGAAHFDAAVTVYGANGIDQSVGSDTDADIITLSVTGTPKISWDESEDIFAFSKPFSIINDDWIEFIDNAGTGFVNMFKGSTGDEIDVGAILNTGVIELYEDAGAVFLIDMPVSATPAAATEMSISMGIDSNVFIKMYSEADSSGGIQNEEVQFPYATVSSVGQQSTATAVVATSDGLTTGLIPANASVVTTTVDTDANDIITLPASIVGMQIRIYTDATGCEMRTTAASNITINNVDSDGTNELALAGSSSFVAECVSATAWIVRGWDNLGADLAALVPDAA